MSEAVVDELPHLTPRQLQAQAWVYDYWAANKHGPTQWEIAVGFGASRRTATAAPFIDPLVTKGYIQRTPATNRNVRPTTKAVQKLSLEGKLAGIEKAKLLKTA